MIKELFKSRRFITVLSMALTLVIMVISNFFIPSDTMPVEFSTVPILSLLLGPYAIVGFLIVEVLNWIFFFKVTNPQFILFNGVFVILLGTLPWKLWYCIQNKNGFEVPNMNSLYNFIKELVILLIIALESYILINNDLCMIETPNMNLYFSTAVMSFVLLLIFIGLFGRFKIPVYTPRMQFKKILPKKIYDLSLLISICILVGIILTKNFNNNYIVILSLIFTTIFLIKPYEKGVFDIDSTIKLNMFYKVCISIFIIIIILSLFITISIVGAVNLIYHFNEEVNREVLFYDYVSIFANFIIVFLIPLIIYMLFLERQMINPIKQLSKYLSNDIDTYDDVERLENNLNSITVKNEIKSLSESLIDMEKNLVDYGAELIEVTSEKERYETELKLAHDIQNSMIPTDFENFNENKNFDIWGSMEAAREVGGDFYDYFQINEDNIGFVIGDVSGKGVTAALIMVKAMTLIEDYAKQYKDLSKVFYEVNNELCNGNSEGLFVTCWFGRLNTKTGEVTYINAGHNPPLIKGESGFEYLNSEPDLVLAAMEDMPYDEKVIQLGHGDMIYLYTDGVTEANDNYKGFYGEERLQNILNSHKSDDLNVIIDSIKKDIDEFCNNQEQFDDTTMFILRFN
nr:PP2C family protein-serine/threonine phosphatase [uncultured Methanobrevibacter sp.]